MKFTHRIAAVIVILLCFSALSVFAYSEQTELCIDRIYGVILTYTPDYEVSLEMDTEIANFCLVTNTPDDYYSLTELAQLSRDVAEDFFGRTLVSRDAIDSIANAMFVTDYYPYSYRDDYLDLIDTYHLDVTLLKQSYVNLLEPLIDDGYTFAATDLNTVEDQYDLFLDLHSSIESAMTNNFVCMDGTYDDVNTFNCNCFDGYDWDASYSSCEESVYVEPPPVEDPPTFNPFTDLSEAHKNFDAIIYLYNEGVISGYPDETFKADGQLNRAELLKILVEGVGYSPDAAIYKDCYPDVGSEWFARYVCFATEQGWVEGYPDLTFKPANNVLKVEAIKMLLEVFSVAITDPTEKTYDDVNTGEWFSGYIHTAKMMGLLEETGPLYEPAKDITRGSISESIYRLLLP